MLKVYNVQRQSAKSLLAAAAAGLVVAAAAPAAASAHAIIAIDRGTIVYSARDATSQNTLTATVSGDKVRLYDPTVDGGIAPGPPSTTPGTGSAAPDSRRWTASSRSATSMRSRVAASRGQNTSMM
jgi:outer membrane receptor protein involved in Fe transport